MVTRFLVAGLAILSGGCQETVDEALRTFKSDTGAIYDLEISPDGQLLALGTAAHDARIWDVATGAELAVLTGHHDPVFAIAFARDGTRLITAAPYPDGQASTIYVWDVSSVSAQSMHDAIGASGRVLMKPGTGNPVVTLVIGGQVRRIALSPDGRTLAIRSGKSERVYDVTNDQATERFAIDSHSRLTFDIAFSPDGRVLAISGEDAKPGGEDYPPEGQAFPGDTGVRDTSVKLWDAKTGQPLGVLNSPANVMRGLVFTPDGTSLIAGCNTGGKGIVVIRNMADQEAPPRRLNAGGQVCALAVSPDGRRLAVAAQITIERWDLPELRKAAALSGHTDQINALEYLSDGRTLLSAGYDGCVKVWRIEREN